MNKNKREVFSNLKMSVDLMDCIEIATKLLPPDQLIYKVSYPQLHNNYPNDNAIDPPCTPKDLLAAASKLLRHNEGVLVSTGVITIHTIKVNHDELGEFTTQLTPRTFNVVDLLDP